MTWSGRVGPGTSRGRERDHSMMRADPPPNRSSEARLPLLFVVRVCLGSGKFENDRSKREWALSSFASLGSVCFGLFEFEMMMDYALRRLFIFFVLYFIFQFFRRSAPA